VSDDHSNRPFVSGANVDGKPTDPPAEERGVERLMTLYDRRQKDIFG
jgi:hypothetical protein